MNLDALISGYFCVWQIVLSELLLGYKSKQPSTHAVYRAKLYFNQTFLAAIIFFFCLQGRRGGNEYPQSMFCIKNKKNRYTPINPSFAI